MEVDVIIFGIPGNIPEHTERLRSLIEHDIPAEGRNRSMISIPNEGVHPRNISKLVADVRIQSCSDPEAIEIAEKIFEDLKRWAYVTNERTVLHFRLVRVNLTHGPSTVWSSMVD